MEGSRVFGTADEYSDYDIVFATRNNAPYFGSKIWTRELAMLIIFADCPESGKQLYH
ncbi:MAG: aminoglycoside 6-adenylyltransferase [Holosporaceae bacterium]|nr:aminoglycoside 6-adenylyltransferase [Holosporaceae bacterium]